jgi:hypothetical protein
MQYINDIAKKSALMEQERDFLKNEIHSLKENSQKKDGETSDINR